MNKLPPIEKIYEAYSAIADQRVVLKQDHGEVFSSDHSKCYTVSFDEDTYSSNDNASYWQGYAGYPVIAVLFLQGRLPFNPQTADLFKEIPWNSLNKEYKRDYSKAVESVMTQRNMDTEAIRKETEAVYQAMKQLPITMKRSKLHPPK